MVCVEGAEQYLCFSQKDYRYIMTIKFSGLKRTSICQDGKQYFYGYQSFKSRKVKQFIEFSEIGGNIKFKPMFDVFEY